jgi:hypothetical protein
MESMQEPAIAAFNEFLRSQLEVRGDANLTLVQFDDQYEVPVLGKPLKEVPELNAKTYVPRGSTALLDAIGRTIKETTDRLAPVPEKDKPGRVIVAIFTDGYENASQTYTNQHISDLINLYRKEKGWEFLFLAANQDAIATATSMNMHHTTAGNVTMTPLSIAASSKALSRKTKAMRYETAGALDEETTADNAKTLQELVTEEETKGK